MTDALNVDPLLALQQRTLVLEAWVTAVIPDSGIDTVTTLIGHARRAALDEDALKVLQSKNVSEKQLTDLAASMKDAS